MAYTPINWQTGDTITAEKMNKMDNGWGVQESQLFSESVTTEDDGGAAWGDFAYSTPITAETLVVTFNGVDYTCARTQSAFGDYYYGADLGSENPFTTYPFGISTNEIGNSLATQNAGTYTVTAVAKVTEASSNFAGAVNSVVVHPDTSMIPLLCVSGETTATKIGEAYSAKRLMYFTTSNLSSIVYDYYIIRYVDTLRGTVQFYPENTDLNVRVVKGIFTVTSA